MVISNSALQLSREISLPFLPKQKWMPVSCIPDICNDVSLSAASYREHSTFAIGRQKSNEKWLFGGANYILNSRCNDELIAVWCTHVQIVYLKKFCKKLYWLWGSRFKSPNVSYVTFALKSFSINKKRSAKVYWKVAKGFFCWLPLRFGGTILIVSISIRVVVVLFFFFNTQQNIEHTGHLNEL